MKRTSPLTKEQMAQEKIDGVRKCITCFETKSLTRFGNAAMGANGKRRQCCDCMYAHIREKRKIDPEFRKRDKEQKRKVYLKKVYNITYIEYDEMLKRQNYKCAICGGNNNSMDKHLAVDHCHETGEVRGLLCDWCNNILGRAKDNKFLLLACVEYLKKYNEREKCLVRQ